MLHSVYIFHLYPTTIRNIDREWMVTNNIELCNWNCIKAIFLSYVGISYTGIIVSLYCNTKTVISICRCKIWIGTCSRN